ncbi:MAG TPA: 4-hydroxy-tetrahydrodipicolinate synthase [Dictyoglomaceae bacterium]|nr:4-hydroxy-tetrahydrodipicolinate synthase [Dictyoglomaceae bacterium]HOL40130.1 4-hydroxy-tetrahydrodipicolinate synthase [Dictyoglomaceae bacterium]HOP95423.1 4-hydroxy-tetrahydrodipicolinate synthase [Dictyoglomaceae bacterium]HPP15578.1 4-hydroxy-tetrahydrodipicolinate synthase [Dictyoglomaceae bacterium]HPU42893.1 4-hydroxy-tetrahydrodipicolinate synthase [Dictyoglomaceae bacterium]
MVHFGSLITAMITPFNEDGEINWKEVDRIIEKLIADKSDSILVSGTTGEAPTLSIEEKLALFERAKKLVGGRAKIIAGTTNYCTKESIELTKEAEKIGVDGILATAPYYNKPPQDGLYLHFAKIASETNLPIIIYNIPSRTAVNIQPETLKRLAADCPNIVGVKEASGDVNQISNIRRLLPRPFLLYSGDDSMTLPLLSIGGDGIISVASHIVGKEIKEMIESFFKGDIAKASELHLKLLPIFRGLFVTTNPIPLKEALKLLGYNVGKCRLPLSPIDAKSRDELIKILKEYGFEINEG